MGAQGIKGILNSHMCTHTFTLKTNSALFSGYFIFSFQESGQSLYFLALGTLAQWEAVFLEDKLFFLA